MKKKEFLPKNGHRIHGISSENFLNAKEIINDLNLKGTETFLDAGCGDGHIAMEALNSLTDDATIYAIDNYEPSIIDLQKEIKEKNIKNMIALTSDISQHISIEDELIDISLLVNVFHGFKARQTTYEAISELKRITKTGGKIAIMDYKKIHAPHGPKYEVRSTIEELETMFAEQNLKKVYLNYAIGEDIKEDNGKSHFLIIFEK